MQSYSIVSFLEAKIYHVTWTMCKVYIVLILCAKFGGYICHISDVYIAVSRSEILIISKRAPGGATDVIQFKHFYKKHYKVLGKKLCKLNFFIFKGFTHAHAGIFQTKSITIILHFSWTYKCVNRRKSK